MFQHAQPLMVVLRRRRLPALLSLLISLGAGGAYIAERERLYEGTALVLVSRENIAERIADASVASPTPQEFAQLLRTQSELARSPEVARAALARTGTDLTAARFLERSDVTPQVETDLVAFSVRSPDEQEAQRLANAYAAAFTAYSYRLRTSSVQRARLRIEDRIRELERSPRGGIDEAVLAQLLDKQEELRTFEALQTSNATLARPASQAELVQPRPLRDGLLVILLGLGLALLVVILSENADPKVRDPEEVERGSGLARLGLIPRPGVANPLAPPPAAAEALAVIRTNLQLLSLGRSMRSLAITSAQPNEGKSTTAASLAVSFARIGREVVLIELDLRRPSLKRALDLDRGDAGGLAQVLTNDTTLADALIDVPLVTEVATSSSLQKGRLRLLPAGRPVPNPAEVVGSSTFKELFAEILEEQEVLVIVDLPPIVFGETLQVLNLVDASAMVARLGVVTRPGLRRLHEATERLAHAPLGVIITDAPRADIDYYAYGYAEGAPGVEPRVAVMPSE